MLDLPPADRERDARNDAGMRRRDASQQYVN
jgi:hypothetical protein